MLAEKKKKIREIDVNIYVDVKEQVEEVEIIFMGSLEGSRHHKKGVLKAPKGTAKS